MRDFFTKQNRQATETERKAHVYDAVVVGAGAAGIGIGVALKDAGLENFLVVDRHTVGASFAAWPEETRFITPSFSTNSVGMLDLNSVAVGVSPAYSLQVEHPTGREYASHLIGVAALFNLPIRPRTPVLRISKPDDLFRIDTQENTLLAKHVIWAAGEFQYPKLNGIQGVDLCQHTATVASYTQLEGDDFIIIGGYESGIDAAYHLARANKRVRLFDNACPWQAETSDPSAALSTYSLERMREQAFYDQVTLYPHTKIVSATRDDELYQVETDAGDRFQSPVPPLFAGGFEGSHKLVKELFEQREDGFPLLSEHDESTIMPGLFLCGPAVRHDNHVFCFIYKYRQRFAVVAKAIATSLGLPAEYLEQYRSWGMYLDDLSCCGQECAC